jgi:hypothetical protein
LKRLSYLLFFLNVCLYGQSIQKAAPLSVGSSISNGPSLVYNVGQSVIGKASNGMAKKGILYLVSNSSTPSVTLSSSDSDNIISNSEVVTITATFSESMTPTPTISLSGIISNVLMSATASASVWEYIWTVSGATVTSTTATVSGSNLSGNTYSGTESITFIIDNTAPTVTFTDTDSDDIVSNSNVVTITATFSESMASTPTISFSGIVSDSLMNATASDTIWTYSWTVSNTDLSSTIVTVSGTDLSGNPIASSDIINFTIDNIPPQIKMTGPSGYNYLGYFNEHFYFINNGYSSGEMKNWNDAKIAAEDLMTGFTMHPKKEKVVY